MNMKTYSYFNLKKPLAHSPCKELRVLEGQEKPSRNAKNEEKTSAAKFS
jgi:hypothetical protein